MYLRRFQVQGFKNFRHAVALEDLGRLNVLHGDNNAGKSNLIEAIGVFFLLVEQVFEVPSAGASLLESGGANVSDLDGEAWRRLGEAAVQRLLERTRDLQGFPEPGPAGWPEPGQPLLPARDSQPWRRKREVDRRLLERRGHPAREMFHLHEPGPIEIAASIAIAPGELGRAGLQAPGALATGEIERIDVTVRLATVVNVLELELVHLALGAADAPVAVDLDAPIDAVFLRRLGAFLGRAHDAEGKAGGRRFALVEADRWVEGAGDWSHAGRDMIPPDLCLALYDAKESAGEAEHARWQRFVTAMQRFEEILGPGQFMAVYDRREKRASLVFDPAAGPRVPAHLLGTGIQQAASLVGRMIMSRATILAVEEPELNLRYTRQVQLREILAGLVGADGAPAQLFLTSHSAAFESPGGFHGLRSTADGPVVDRRPSSEASAFTGQGSALVPPPGARAPLCYVSSEGLVLVPEEVRQELGIQGGGGVYFVYRKGTGHFEMLTDEQFLALLEDPDREEP
jgi:hypothetical protein